MGLWRLSSRHPVVEARVRRGGELAARDRAVLWHPYTQALGSPAPLEVVGGEGAYLHTADGRRVFDGI